MGKGPWSHVFESHVAVLGAEQLCEHHSVDLLEDFNSINAKLVTFGAALGRKPQVVILRTTGVSKVRNCEEELLVQLQEVAEQSQVMESWWQWCGTCKS
jgi:hypothetical protein